MSTGGSDAQAGPWSELARRLVARPGRASVLALVAAAVAAGLVATRLELSADRMQLLGRQHAYARQFAELQDDFGDIDSIVVLVRAATRDASRAFADDLASRLAADGERFRGVFHRVPDEALRGKALLFLERADLAEVERRLSGATPALAALGEGGAGGLLEHVTARVRSLSAGDAEGGDLEFLARLVEGLAGVVADGRAYEAAWRELIPAGVQARDGYVWTDDGRLVLLAEPRARAGRERLEAVDALRATVAAAVAAAPGVEVGLTGSPVLEADERATFVSDAARATLASFVGLAVLLAVSLRRVASPLVVLFGLAWAVTVSLGGAALWPGHLNLITIVVGALLVGIGADGALHVVTRHDVERARGAPAGREAVERALAGAGAPVTAAAVTVALAFLSTIFTEVAGIRELGVLACGGLLVCLAASLLVVPPLLAWLDRAGPAPRHRPAGWRLAALDAVLERRPVLALLLATLLAAGGAWLALTPDDGGRRRLRYEPNLLRLQPRVESVRLAAEVLADQAVTGMFATIVVPDLPSLEDFATKVRELSTVSRAESLLDVVPPDQPAKLEVMRRLAGCLERIAPAFGATLPAGAPATRLERVERAAADLATALEQAARGALAAHRADDVAAVISLQIRLETLAAAPPAERPRRAAALEAWEAALRQDLGGALVRLREECAAGAVTLEDLPLEVRDRFVGKTGRYLLRVYPRGDIWDREQREAFLAEVGGVAPDVGGFPRQLTESDRLLTEGVRRAALLALALVALALLVHARSLVVPLVAGGTLLVAGGWSLGLLALLDVELNPANLLAIPLALGVGVAHVIHLAHCDREARRVASVGGPAPVLGTSVGRAVVLSGLATLVAFGALALAEHRGLATLGASAALGTATCLAAALIVAPALLRLLAGPWVPPLLGGPRGPKTGPDGRPRRL